MGRQATECSGRENERTLGRLITAVFVGRNAYVGIIYYSIVPLGSFTLQYKIRTAGNLDSDGNHVIRAQSYIQ